MNENEKWVSREEFARFEARTVATLEEIRGLLVEMKPMWLGQSGDRATMDGIRRDLDSLHEKSRTLFHSTNQLELRIRDEKEAVLRTLTGEVETIMGRLERMEKRDVRLGGIIVGAVAVLQFLIPVLSAWARQFWPALPGGGP